MTTHSQTDPIDTDIAHALAALNTAAPPEDMDARILARLTAHPPTPARWQNLMPQTAWLRGAFTGALIATAACALAFYITRSSGSTRPATYAGVPHSSQLHRDEWDEKSSPANSPTPVALRSGDQCANRDRERRAPHPDSAWVGNVAATARVPHPYASFADGWGEDRMPRVAPSRTPHLIPASFAPSKPAPPAPLTAQERALVQLAANPAALAALTHAADQKSDAQREADFQKFFAPSPELIAAQKAQEEAINPANPATQQPNEVHN